MKKTKILYYLGNALGFLVGLIFFDIARQFTVFSVKYVIFLMISAIAFYISYVNFHLYSLNREGVYKNGKQRNRQSTDKV